MSSSSDDARERVDLAQDAEQDAQHDDSRTESAGASAETTRSSSEATASPLMRARTWAIAGRYSNPVDYDIPRLPTWDVRQPESGGLAFAAAEDTKPFITAEQPIKVRR